jgi:diguanylate cyclase (GGDEF)-like protein
MKELAIKDGLTNLYNRRFLLSRILEEQSRVRRFEVQDPPPATGLIMLDIDHFKKINDTYGHIAGDSILKQLASRVEKNIRAYDILGRYGGEEFLIVAPNTDMQSSIAIGEKICAVVGALPFEVNGKQLDVTISVGVGCMLSSDTDLEKAIKRADAALYEAKAGGRNRVCWTDTPPDRESSEDPVVLPGGEAAESPPATHC